MLESQLGFEELVEMCVLDKVLALAIPTNEICFCGIFGFVESFASRAQELRWQGWPQVKALRPTLEACLHMVGKFFCCAWAHFL